MFKLLIFFLLFLLQTIKDLDDNDPDLKGQMTLIYGAMEKYFKEELTQHGPFTLFAPTNEGFRAINTGDVRRATVISIVVFMANITNKSNVPKEILTELSMLNIDAVHCQYM